MTWLIASPMPAFFSRPSSASCYCEYLMALILAMSVASRFQDQSRANFIPTNLRGLAIGGTALARVACISFSLARGILQIRQLALRQHTA